VSVDGRGQARRRALRRVGLVAAALVLLALLFLAGGHWVLGIIFGVAAVAAIWVFMQMRTVR
jgi:fatty acid desaturase